MTGMSGVAQGGRGHKAEIEKQATDEWKLAGGRPTQSTADRVTADSCPLTNSVVLRPAAMIVRQQE